MWWTWKTTISWNAPYTLWIRQDQWWLDPIQGLGSVQSHRLLIPPQSDVSQWYQFCYRSLGSLFGPPQWLSTVQKCQGHVQHYWCYTPRKCSLAEFYYELQRISTRNPLFVHKMIGNPEFKHEFEYTPYHGFSVDGQHYFENLMSGNWAWKQAVS